MSEGRLKVAAALLLTSPFVPMLFQGEEWGASAPFPYFTDHADPDLGWAVRTGRRREFAAFGWDPDDVPDPQHSSTFERARLDWDERDKAGHADLLRWYRQLIELRRRFGELTDPRLSRVATDYDESARWLTVRRGNLLVAANLGVGEWTCQASRDAQVLAASDPGVRRVPSGLVLPPDTAAVLIAAGAGQAHDG